MRDQAKVTRRYFEAHAAHESFPSRRAAQLQRSWWFIYDRPDVDACVLGSGTTENDAWKDAARRLSQSRRRTKVFLAD
jgi:hypothetical protein